MALKPYKAPLFLRKLFPGHIQRIAEFEEHLPNECAAFQP